MNSSDQFKNTQVSRTAPAVTNGQGRRSSRLTADQQHAVTEAVGQFHLAGWHSKIHAFYVYRARCAETNLPAASVRTFYRRLRDQPTYPASPRLSHFLAVALIDETAFEQKLNGGSSS